MSARAIRSECALSFVLIAVLSMAACDAAEPDVTMHPAEDDATLARVAPGKRTCNVGNGGCDANASCTQLRRDKVWCACKAGFAGNGLRCVAASTVQKGKCSTNNGGCAADATCTQVKPNQVGCACKQGFEGSGVSCTDVDECRTDNGGCDANATCSNTKGSRTCTCNAGYEGDGFTCTAKPSGGARLRVDPDQHDFGAVIRGSWDWPLRTFRVTNVGDAATKPLFVIPTGPDGSVFRDIDGNQGGCRNKVLGPGGFCVFAVEFSPANPNEPTGAKKNVYFIRDETTGTSLTVTGTSAPPPRGVHLTIKPTSVDFGGTAAGTSGQ